MRDGVLKMDAIDDAYPGKLHLVPGQPKTASSPSEDPSSGKCRPDSRLPPLFTPAHTPPWTHDTSASMRRRK